MIVEKNVIENYTTWIMTGNKFQNNEKSARFRTEYILPCNLL